MICRSILSFMLNKYFYNFNISVYRLFKGEFTVKTFQKYSLSWELCNIPLTSMYGYNLGWETFNFHLFELSCAYGSQFVSIVWTKH